MQKRVKKGCLEDQLLQSLSVGNSAATAPWVTQVSKVDLRRTAANKTDSNPIRLVPASANNWHLTPIVFAEIAEFKRGLLESISQWPPGGQRQGRGRASRDDSLQARSAGRLQGVRQRLAGANEHFNKQVKTWQTDRELRFFSPRAGQTRQGCPYECKGSRFRHVDRGVGGEHVLIVGVVECYHGAIVKGLAGADARLEAIPP